MRLIKGMYIRTETQIGKLISKNNVDTRNGWVVDGMYFTPEKDILKASFNLIDLIEPNDIVNKQAVAYIKEKNGVKMLKDYEWNMIAFNDDIESILTKEQYQKHAYQVKEGN